MQKEIIINDVKIPVIEESGVIYYPISYIGSKVLLKVLTGNQLIKNGYGKYIKQIEVDYGEDTGGVQNTYCISEDGLKEILRNSKIGGLSIEQKRAMKEVCNHINLKMDIDFNAKFKEFVTEEEINQHDFWTKECINSLPKDMFNMWQKCSKCGKYYPYHENFWIKEVNKRNKQPLRGICNNCEKVHVKYYDDNDFTKAYYEGEELLYNILKNSSKNIYEIYNAYLEGKIEYPFILRNSLNTTNIIVKLYRDIILKNTNNCTKEFINELTKIPLDYISMKSLDRHLFQKIKKEELLKTKIDNPKDNTITKRIIKRMTFEDAKYLLDMYIHNNNIKIDDVYNYNYNKLFENAKVKYYIESIHKDKLGFIMKYFDNQYAAYKFRSIVGQKYWENRDNADQAMKYFIENDLKIPIEKIPLYVTKMNLQMKANTLYNIIYKKRFDDTIFDWISRLYPGKFIEEDFSIGVIRNEFDSMDEKLIDDMLRQRFQSVVYNYRNSNNKVTIMGMNPDWFVFTDRNLYIVEYFGIALNHGKYNQRISDYINKSEDKLEKYERLPYAEKIYLYPSDIKGDCEGFKDKIKMIV